MKRGSLAEDDLNAKKGASNQAAAPFLRKRSRSPDARAYSEEGA